MSKTCQAFIVTEGGGDIGFGHLARCQSLYQALEEVDIHPVLLVHGDRKVAEFCRQNRLQVIPWHSEPERLWPVIGNADVVVIDSLLGPEEFFSRLQAEIKTPVFIDDYKRRSYVRGVVIDWTIQAEHRFYARRHPQVTYLLGTHYAALRQEFWDSPFRPTRTRIDKVLVTFGGSDVANMTPRTLKLLARRFDSLTVDVVIGPGFVNAEEVLSLILPEYRVYRSPGARQMNELMLEADLAIATGGQTLYELARMGIPTIAVMVSDNQANDIAGWEQAGFLRYAGTPSDIDMEDRLVFSLRQFESYDTRLECSRLGRSHIDGNGARRIARILSELI